MSKNFLKWGAVGVSLVVLTLVFFPSKKSRGFELFAAASTDPLHPTEQVAVQSPANSVPEAIKQAGVDYYPEDKVSVFPDPSFGIGSYISITRALPITIVDGKKKYIARTWADTVSGLVDEKKLNLGDDDKITPPLNTQLTTSMTITIVRVARTTVTEKEVIAYQTVEKEDATMWRGETKVTQEGKNGERTKKYLVIREDGELVSKTLTSNEVTTAVTNKIIVKGTKLKIGKTFSGKLTWYDLRTKVAINSSTGLKKGQEVRVTNISNGKNIIVKIDDYCPASAGCAGIIDLSPTYFKQLQSDLYGSMPQVKVEEILN